MNNQFNMDSVASGYLIESESRISRYTPSSDVKVIQEKIDFYTPIEDLEYVEWKRVNGTFEGVVLVPARNPVDRSNIYMVAKIDYQQAVENPLSDRLSLAVDSFAEGVGAYGPCDMVCTLTGLWNKVSSTWESSKTSTENKTITYFSEVIPSREDDYEFLKSIPAEYLSVGDRNALSEYRYEEESARPDNRLESRVPKKRLHLPKCIKKVSRNVRNFFTQRLLKSYFTREKTGES